MRDSRMRIRDVLSVVLLGGIVVACGGGTASTPSPEPLRKVGVMIDSGSGQDKSFNEFTLKGAREASAEAGLEFAFVMPQAASDYANTLEGMIASEDPDLVITVGFRMGDVTAVDAMTHDGLTNPFTEKQMINEASEVSNELEITRADMDKFAVRSHERAHRATEEGRLAEEIVSVTVKGRKGDTVVEADEAIRPDTDLESLSKLKAVGGDDATHTAGNAPGVNDGAAAVVTRWRRPRSAGGGPPADGSSRPAGGGSRGVRPRSGPGPPRSRSGCGPAPASLRRRFGTGRSSGAPGNRCSSSTS